MTVLYHGSDITGDLLSM